MDARIFSLELLHLLGLFGLGTGLLLGLLVLAVVLILLVIHFGFLLFIPAAWPQGQFVPGINPEFRDKLTLRLSRKKNEEEPNMNHKQNQNNRQNQQTQQQTRPEPEKPEKIEKY